MSKLLSRFKHEEFELNSELQVRNHKKKRSINHKKREAETRRREEAESRAATLPLAPSFTFHCTVHFPTPFYLFASFVTFWFASHFSLYVIVTVHVIW